MRPTPPKAITVDALRLLCEAEGERAAVMISVSEHGTLFTTWGKTAEDKLYAKGLSDYIGGELCRDAPSGIVYESFIVDAAKVKEQRDELLAALKLYVEHFGDPLKVARTAIAMAESRAE